MAGPELEKHFSKTTDKVWGLSLKSSLSFFESLSNVNTPSLFLSPSLFYRIKKSLFGSQKLEIRAGYELETLKTKTDKQVNQDLFLGALMEFDLN